MTKSYPNRANGGIQRAKNLTPQERSESSRNASLKRWGYKVTHKGNFQEILGLDIPCYVLNDSNHTPVLSQRGMAEALGFKRVRGDTLKSFLFQKSMMQYVGPDLKVKLDQPIVFKGLGVAGFGYDVTILIDVCHSIIQAYKNGDLPLTYIHLFNNASTILGASAKLGIRELVYKLSGYDSTKEQVIEAFRIFVLEEATKWAKEFPDILYSQWQRIFKIPVPQKGKSWKYKHLTLKYIYIPLAHSNGKLLQLLREAKGEQKSKKLHQFLSEIGKNALKEHIWQVVGIALASQSESEFDIGFTRAFGQQLHLEFEEIFSE